MNQINRWIILVLSITALTLSGCAQKSALVEKIKPAQLEAIEGTSYKRIILTQKASERLGIETAPVSNKLVDGSEQKVIPYAAVMYGLQGETWTYINPEPLIYQRQTIVIKTIQGDLAVLSEGPAPGTMVVTVGAAELYGTEVGVSK